MQHEPVVGLYFDSRSPSKKNDNKCPVKVRITWDVGGRWDSRYLRTGQYLTSKEDFEILEKGKAKSSDLKRAQTAVFKVRSQAEAIIQDNRFIGIDAFFYEYDKRYGGGKDIRNPALVRTLFDELVQEKRGSEDVGTADSYDSARKSVLRFGGEDMLITAVTPEWLRQYERWMVDELGNSLNSVGIYLRPLRSLCKRAVKRKYMNPDLYPFGREAYVIRKKRTKKKALPVFVSKNILRHEPKPADAKSGYTMLHRNMQIEGMEMAIDICMFSYLSHGMNMADIAYLHEDDFRSDHFKFIRRKTRKTSLEPREIEVSLSPPLREILARRATHRGYVFGIITQDMDAVTKKKKIKQWIKTVNKWLRRIAQKVGYTDRVTTYSWRHTFVTALLNAGVPITKVKDAIGWQNIVMIQEYAEDLDLQTSKGFTDILIKP